MDALFPPVIPEKTDGAQAQVPAFATVYGENLAFVFRSARALGVRPAAVDDVVQEVFVVVYRRLGTFDGQAKVRTWISRILVNVVRHHRRTLVRKSPHEQADGKPGDPDELPAAGPNPCEAVVLGERAQIVQRLLDGMDDDKREMLVLAEIEELPVPEIAAILGLKLNTAYSRLRLARRAFDDAVARARAEGRLR
jgi:RNA polymerase sigma-70 factor (ECF subfamily)